MLRELESRVALVTGGGRGIGRAIALAYGRAGARVAVAARSAAEVEEVVAAIAAEGGTALPVVADVAERSVAADVVQLVRDQLGPVEILVNNAGVGSSAHPAPVEAFDDAFWDLTLAVNLTAPYLLSKAALPDMLAAKWGRIIMIASINSQIASMHGAAYTASKHGVVGLARTIALETASRGVTCNSICPGPVKTVMNDKRIAYDAERRGIPLADLEKGLTPVGGRLDPEDIAPLAVYLASPAARMVTGQSFNVDGGIVMS